MTVDVLIIGFLCLWGAGVLAGLILEYIDKRITSHNPDPHRETEGER